MCLIPPAILYSLSSLLIQILALDSVSHRVDKYNRPESPSLDEHSMQSYLDFILSRLKNHHKTDEGLIDIYSVLERKPRTVC